MSKPASSTGPQDKLQNLAKALLKHPVVALASPDHIRRERAVNYIVDEYSKLCDLKRTLAHTAIKIEKNTLESVSLSLRNVSLFEREKVWVLSGVEALLKQEQITLSSALSLLPKGSIVLIVVPDLKKNSVLIKDLESKELTYDLGELHGATLLRWVERELKTQGISEWDSGVPDRLAALGEQAADKIAPIVEQLALYLGDEERATREVLERLYPSSIHATEFELLDALLAKDPRKAEVLIQALVRNGTNIFSLMGLVSKSLLNIQRIRIRLDKGESQSEIRNRLGMQPWIFGKQVEVAKKIVGKKLEKTLVGLLKMDSKLKNKSVAHDALLSELREALQG